MREHISQRATRAAQQAHTRLGDWIDRRTEHEIRAHVVILTGGVAAANAIHGRPVIALILAVVGIITAMRA